MSWVNPWVHKNQRILVFPTNDFGATHSILALFLRCSIKLLYKVLKEEPSARVEIPSVEEIRDYQEVISSHFPVLNGTWCVVDRLKIPIQKSGDEQIQNA
jgi:hypothetical protein